MASSSAEKQSLIGQGTTFIKECRTELDKVTHPTRQETIQATLVVLVIVIFVAGMLALMDVVFHSVMSTVL